MVNNMKVIVVYPYSRRIEKIIELLETKISKDYEFLLVTNSIRRYQKCNDNIQNSRIVSAAEFDSGEFNYAVLWIVDSEEEVEFENDLMCRIGASLEQQKRVVVTRRLDLNERAKLSRIENENLVLKRSASIQQTILYDIQTPVIVIDGLCPGIGGLKTGLDLMKAMRDRGYHVSLLGDSGDIAICGCRYIYDEFFDGGTTIQTKVHMFNNMLHEIEIEDDPDAIIVVVPDDYHIRLEVKKDNYGENLYALSKSCDIDYVIINTSYDYHRYCIENSVDGYRDISSLCLKEIDAINVINMKLLTEETEMVGYPQWLFLDKSMCGDLSDITSSPMVVSEDLEVVARDVEDKLSEYSEAPRW